MNTISKILKNLFGGRKTAAMPETPAAAGVMEHSAPPVDLFTCTDKPAESKPAATKSAVDAFMERDFLTEGRVQGYTMHCSDGMDQHLQTLSAGFRNAVHRDIKALEESMFQLQAMLIDLGGMLPSTRSKLELKLSRLGELKRSNEEQIELSVDGEGIISSALHTFRTGYRAGFNDYLEENDFMKAPVAYAQPV